MQSRIFFFILIAALASCSGVSKKKGSSSTGEAGERPQWLFEAGKACKQNELCAVGEAPGSLGADVVARKNLAKIFEIKVKSELNIKTTSESTTIDQVVSGIVNEDVQEKIQEQTEQVLRGVEIKRVYEGKESYFALAVLDKALAARRIASEIEAVDTEMIAYINDGRRSSLNKALKKYYIRNALNDRHQFLVDRRIATPVSLSSILNKKSKKRALGTTVRVKFEEVGGISEVHHLLISHLLENDFKVITDKKRTSQFAILGSLKKEKKHMNVKGFKRYKFFLQLKSQNNQGEKIGALDFNTTQAGRTLEHAYENAMPEIRDFLDDKLGELNID